MYCISVKSLSSDYSPSFSPLTSPLCIDINRSSIDIKNVCALSMQPKIWCNFVWTDSAQIFFYNICKTSVLEVVWIDK